MVFLKTVRNAFFCALGAEGAALLLLFLFCFLSRTGDDPLKNAALFALLSAFAGSALGGGVCALLSRETPLWAGLLCGVIFSLFTLALSFLPGGEKSVGGSLLLLAFSLLPALLSAAAAAKLCGEKRKKRRRKAKKRRT